MWQVTKISQASMLSAMILEVRSRFYFKIDACCGLQAVASFQNATHPNVSCTDEDCASKNAASATTVVHEQFYDALCGLINLLSKLEQNTCACPELWQANGLRCCSAYTWIMDFRQYCLRMLCIPWHAGPRSACYAMPTTSLTILNDWSQHNNCGWEGYGLQSSLAAGFAISTHG